MPKTLTKICLMLIASIPFGFPLYEVNIFGKIKYYLTNFWDGIEDPRTADLPLINGGIWKILSIMAIYILISRIILPRVMKNRKPLTVRNPMLLYNVVMVMANGWLFLECLQAVDCGRIFLDFRYPSRQDRSPQTMRMLRIGWWFLITRFMDLLDTVFFVLRKKDSQITFLHLYHHSIVPILTWLCLKVNPMAPIIRLFGLLNTLIHVVMYLYYALAAFGPEIQKYLWWKKYITQIQILQFAICGSYGIILYCLQSGYPMGWFYFVVGQNPIFLYLFYDFYKKSYNKKKSSEVVKNGKAH